MLCKLCYKEVLSRLLSRRSRVVKSRSTVVEYNCREVRVLCISIQYYTSYYGTLKITIVLIDFSII